MSYSMNMEMSSSINREVSEDVYKDLLINIGENLQLDPDQFFICKVPKSIRKGKEKAYTPQIVSIGPFHYGQKELEDMEKKKWRYVKSFFRRTTSKKREEVLAFIKNHEQRIRKSYFEPPELESHEYVRMILRDAIFILELLLIDYEKDGSDYLLVIPAETFALKLDLLLLENQLPYFLLEGIYHLVVSSPPFINLCCHFFCGPDEMFDSVPDQKVFKHFTDFKRATLVGNFRPQEFDHENYDDYIPCATKLHESAGVKFKLAPERTCLLDIRFEAGTLRIPRLNVHHQTDTTFRNIMAWEQCYEPVDTLVCDYVLLLDNLIEDKRDAQLLVDDEIIYNWLGDTEALAKLFNELSIEIPLVGNHYNKIYHDLRAYHKNICNQRKAKLKRVYFSDIWRGTATVVAAILLILTFIQTMSSVTN